MSPQKPYPDSVIVPCLRRIWVRAALSLFLAIVLVFLLYDIVNLASPSSPSARLLSRLLDFSAPWYAHLPHERGRGPSAATIIGPILTNFVLASVLFYVGFTVWLRHNSNSGSDKRRE